MAQQTWSMKDALAQMEQSFYTKYVNTMLEQAQNPGTFGWDGKNASFKGGTQMGTLSQEWNKFKKAAESRRLKPDYMQFLQIYNQGKQLSNQMFGQEFNKLLTRTGQDPSVIKDLAKSDAIFKDKLLNLSQDATLTPEQQAGFASYIPSEGPSQFTKDLESGNYMTPAMGVAGAGAAGYYLTKPGDVAGLGADVERSVFDFEDLEKERKEGLKRSQKVKMDALDRFDKIDAEIDKISKAKYKPGKQPAGITLSKKLDKDGKASVLKSSEKLKRLADAKFKAEQAAGFATDAREGFSPGKYKGGAIGAAKQRMQDAQDALKEGSESFGGKQFKKAAGFARAGLSLGTTYAGRAVGEYLAGEDKAELGGRIGRLVPEVAFVSRDIANFISSPAGKRMTASVYSRLGKELPKAGTAAAKETLKRKATSALGKRIMATVAKGGARQVMGSSLPVIGNVAMGLWTAYDVVSLIHDYSTGNL